MHECSCLELRRMTVIISYQYHIVSHHIVDLKRQNRLKVVVDEPPKLKVKMQSVSDSDDVRKRLLEKPRFESYIVHRMFVTIVHR